MANTLTFANQTLTDANIFGGINYICDLNTGDEFSIGNTASACVSFVTDTQVPLYTKDQTNGVFEWTQDNTSRGTYYVTEVTKHEGFYTVTAYDGISLLETSIEVLGITSFPLTVADAAAAIETYSGYTLTGTLYNDGLTCTDLDKTMTVRELLGYIAEMSGASIKLNASDELCLMYYEDSEIELTASDYKAIEVADYACAAIDRVVIISNAGEDLASAGFGTNALYIAGNPFADGATALNAQAVLDVVGGFFYTPLTCELFDEEGLEVGTGATIGDAYTLIMHVEASTEEGVTVASVGTDSRSEYNKGISELINAATEAALNRIEGLSVDVSADGDNLVYKATLTRGGVDITTAMLPGDYEWFYRTPNGDKSIIGPDMAVKNGWTITVPRSSNVYGNTVVCEFTSNRFTDLLTSGGDKLLTNAGNYLIGRSEY